MGELSQEMQSLKEAVSKQTTSQDSLFEFIRQQAIIEEALMAKAKDADEARAIAAELRSELLANVDEIDQALKANVPPDTGGGTGTDTVVVPVDDGVLDTGDGR